MRHRANWMRANWGGDVLAVCRAADFYLIHPPFNGGAKRRGRPELTRAQPRRGPRRAALATTSATVQVVQAAGASTSRQDPVGPSVPTHRAVPATHRRAPSPLEERLPKPWPAFRKTRSHNAVAASNGTARSDAVAVGQSDVSAAHPRRQEEPVLQLAQRSHCALRTRQQHSADVR